MDFEARLAEAAAYLAAQDEVLSSVVAASPPCTIRPHNNYYQELVESIIGQQLSVKAAASIRNRFVGLFDGEFPAPTQILEKSVEELRTAGLSGAKARYVRDLAQHVQGGLIKFDRLDVQTNEEIIAELTAVKGIGEWTAHMFLMFCMGRLDVLAHGDLGIRMGIKKLYGLPEIPSSAKVQEIAGNHQWAPYQTVACWYIWQSLDNTPTVRAPH